MIVRIFLITFLFVPALTQAENHDHKAIQPIKVTETISMIQAGGGNIGVSAGEDGLFVVDTAPSARRDKLMAAMKALSDQPVRVLVNTHWHYDHIGNNESFHDSFNGGGAIIIAHENVRKRMSKGGYIAPLDHREPPAAHGALPVVTYASGSASGPTSVHLNGEEAKIFAVDPAHTDGDSFVFWPRSNVIHTGDLFFNGFWPLIDASSGGGIDGVIKATSKILALADEQTKIIPGHGPLARKTDLQAYHDMLKIVATRAKAAKAKNKTAESWASEKPLKDLEAVWGDGFMPTEKFINVVWQGL